jgi:hypothetical protein
VARGLLTDDRSRTRETPPTPPKRAR